jgi:hypothetical protein
MREIERALVVLAPEAEALVAPFRNAGDPAARAGMPAHITLVYPFRPRAGMGAAVVRDLADCFGRFAAFDYALVEVKSFAAAVLYLRPEPEAPFRWLIEAILARYPDTPPYGGAFTAIVPHLTIAQLESAELLQRTAGEFSRAAHASLPIKARAADVVLVDTASGRWRTREKFPLRPAPDVTAADRCVR